MKWTPQQSSGVVLEGYYGMQNAGDDAFCVVGTELASRNWGVSDVALTGPPRLYHLSPLQPVVCSLTLLASRAMGAWHLYPPC